MDKSGQKIKGRLQLLNAMEQHRLIAVVRSGTGEEAAGITSAVIEGGVRFLEITMTVPGALDLVANFSKREDVYMGAGTVLSEKEAEESIAAGARFVVSPTSETNLVPVCRRADVLCVTGAATPTEVLGALRAEADLVKIFPAHSFGGTEYIKQLLLPFPDARFMVSGGVDEKNVQDYVRMGVTGIALGSAMLQQVFREKGHRGLVECVQRFVRLVEDA